MRGTQSVQLQRVKKNGVNSRASQCLPKTFRNSLTGIVLFSMLAACAAPSDGWHQPVKNEKLTQADYRSCRDQAEERTLELNSDNRSGFGVLSRGRTGTFNPRGDNPMAIAEKSDNNAIFKSLVSNCMILKGYFQPN
ncbi:MAG: hypothetical protein ACJZ9F_00770 [Rhodospirillaceae bacterium]